MIDVMSQVDEKLYVFIIGCEIKPQNANGREKVQMDHRLTDISFVKTKCVRSILNSLTVAQTSNSKEIEMITFAALGLIILYPSMHSYSLKYHEKVCWRGRNQEASIFLQT